MQSGADAAAYAAALELARQGLDQAPDLAAMQAVADDAAGRNGVETAVTLNMPPLSGPSAGDPQSVEVIVTEPAPVYFTGLFLGAAPPITTRAVAKAVVSDACVWALHPTAPRARSASPARRELDLDCGVVVNSDHEEAALEQSGSPACPPRPSASPAAIRGSCVSPEPEVFDAELRRSAELSGARRPVGSCDFTDQGHHRLRRWRRSTAVGQCPSRPASTAAGIEVKAGKTCVFEPGLYVLKGGQFDIAGNATVTNTENASGGVTFYLTGTGSNYATLTSRRVPISRSLR